MWRDTVVILPSNKKKYAYGYIAEPVRQIGPADLPTTWDRLQALRRALAKYRQPSKPSTALYLYSGPLYESLRPILVRSFPEILIISGGYGLIRGREPIQRYDARLFGEVARTMRKHGLHLILADYLNCRKPRHIIAIAYGSQRWGYATSKYHWFVRQALLRLQYQPETVHVIYPTYRSATKVSSELARAFLSVINGTGFQSHYVAIDDFRNSLRTVIRTKGDTNGS